MLINEYEDNGFYFSHRGIATRLFLQPALAKEGEAGETSKTGRGRADRVLQQGTEASILAQTPDSTIPGYDFDEVINPQSISIGIAQRWGRTSSTASSMSGEWPSGCSLKGATTRLFWGYLLVQARLV